MRAFEYGRAVTALAGLLEEFRNHRIISRTAEANGMQRHTCALSARWNEQFPGFPEDDFPFTSLRGHYYRKHRDSHLKDIIVRLLAEPAPGTIIVNPACVFGRHACDLASRLPHVKVVATDIDPRSFRIFRLLKPGRLPRNFIFQQDNIFEPKLAVRPTVVVFFGACGAVSDGGLDYGIASGATYIVCRTCCHENIGGNVTVTARTTLVNQLFRVKNRFYKRIRQAPKYPGFFFSPKYTAQAYPRSVAGKNLSTPEEFLRVARDSVDSDICRAIIDLDRYLHLAEHGFRVELQGDLLVAERHGE